MGCDFEKDIYWYCYGCSIGGGIINIFKFKDTSLDKTIEKVKAYDKYVLTCNMEMVENDELKSYLVNVSYFKEKRMSIIKLNFMISH